MRSTPKPGGKPGGRKPFFKGSKTGGGPRRGKRPFLRRKVCRFCADKVTFIDYKNHTLLRSFITDRGKMLAGRVTGTCAKHQRQVGRAMKRAQNIALLPYTIV
ncbi:MAG: 30S ribosomal protein S18 [bacterium]